MVCVMCSLNSTCRPCCCEREGTCIHTYRSAFFISSSFMCMCIVVVERLSHTAHQHILNRIARPHHSKNGTVLSMQMMMHASFPSYERRLCVRWPHAYCLHCCSVTTVCCPLMRTISRSTLKQQRSCVCCALLTPASASKTPRAFISIIHLILHIHTHTHDVEYVNMCVSMGVVYTCFF